MVYAEDRLYWFGLICFKLGAATFGDTAKVYIIFTEAQPFIFREHTEDPRP